MITVLKACGAHAVLQPGRSGFVLSGRVEEHNLAGIPQDSTPAALSPSKHCCDCGCSRQKSPAHWLILGWQLQVKDSTGSALESWQKADSTRDVQVRHAILTVHFANLSQVR